MAEEGWRWKAFREGCQTCDYGEDATTNSSYPAIRCLRYPPTVLYTTSPAGDQDWQQDSPYMKPTDWCGEFKRERSTDGTGTNRPED